MFRSSLPQVSIPGQSRTVHNSKQHLRVPIVRGVPGLGLGRNPPNPNHPVHRDPEPPGKGNPSLVPAKPGRSSAPFLPVLVHAQHAERPGDQLSGPASDRAVRVQSVHDGSWWGRGRSGTGLELYVDYG